LLLVQKSSKGKCEFDLQSLPIEQDVQQDDKEPFFPRVQQGVQLHTDASIALRRVPTGAESHSCTFSDVSGTDEFEKRGK